MSESALDPDFKVALRVWWAYTWRFAVFFLPAAWLLPGVGFLLSPAGGALRKLLSLALFAYMIWLQIELFRRVLAMDFGRFRVRVTAPPAADDIPAGGRGARPPASSHSDQSKEGTVPQGGTTAPPPE